MKWALEVLTKQASFAEGSAGCWWWQLDAYCVWMGGQHKKSQKMLQVLKQHQNCPENEWLEGMFHNAVESLKSPSP